MQCLGEVACCHAASWPCAGLCSAASCCSVPPDLGAANNQAAAAHRSRHYPAFYRAKIKPYKHVYCVFIDIIVDSIKDQYQIIDIRYI